MLLYYITDRAGFPGDEKSRRLALLNKIAEAARSRVDFIQLREKDLSIRELEELGTDAERIVRHNSQTTRFLVNSRVDVAIACGADGVHLPADDISPSDVRKIWSRLRGPAPVISVACHGAADVAHAASQQASFALFAPVFAKKDAPQARPAGLDGLREASRQGLQVLALGGVTLQNARSCIEAGAAGIAGIRLFQDNDVEKVVTALRTDSRA